MSDVSGGRRPEGITRVKEDPEGPLVLGVTGRVGEEVGPQGPLSDSYLRVWFLTLPDRT